MEKYFSVKETAALLGYKNEETIKRKIKDGMFPNAFQNSRKQGWKIPAGDIAAVTGSSPKNIQNKLSSPSTDCNKSELVKLAYQVATLTSPPEEVHEVLASLPLEHALEICLIIRQQNRNLIDPYKFIKAAITKKWTPDPITPEAKQSVIHFTQRDYDEIKLREQGIEKPDFYNWLENKGG
ncbi:hypothetical protein [Domibacillus iocasae]|uniref:Helix-turn-helix domain-containing protein n=1 Tax=Domibacillus iocasae TaxID=1714016 RepID=A0A1E7DPW3_9BACI|nr:hypothetical protein [Domibacillus iocasae]OES45122.1 hypothetical protein BA724_03685 [Domibacillus iocasae]